MALSTGAIAGISIAGFLIAVVVIVSCIVDAAALSTGTTGQKWPHPLVLHTSPLLFSKNKKKNNTLVINPKLCLQSLSLHQFQIWYYVAFGNDLRPLV